MKSFDQIREKHLTPAEMKKREEVAKAIKRENPNMPMAKKMAIATATAKKVAEAKDPGEYDYEGDMAKNSLRTICRTSGEMVAMMDENTNLPEWVQSKITLGEDYITSAYNYMMSEAEEMDESVQDMASMGNRSLSRIAGTVGHPDSAAAKNELARRRMKNEEVELDELNKSTLASYTQKAAGSLAGNAAAAGYAGGQGKKAHPDIQRFMKNRMKGIQHAAKKLAKEETELGD